MTRAGIWMPLSVLHNLRGFVGELGACSSCRHRTTLFLTGGGECSSSLLVGPSGDGWGDGGANGDCCEGVGDGDMRASGFVCPLEFGRAKC
jgi:hypothetical protein